MTLSEVFVVGISWRTAPVAVREKLAFRDDELEPALRAMTTDLPGNAEALLVSTCNRVEVYGDARPGTTRPGRCAAFLAATCNARLDQRPATADLARLSAVAGEAVRHACLRGREARVDSLVLGEAQIHRPAQGGVWRRRRRGHERVSRRALPRARRSASRKRDA